MMADGYGFLRSSDYNYLAHQMIFTCRHLKLDYSVLKPRQSKGGSSSKRRGEIFSFSAKV
jgi:hypothetical protein